MRRLVAFAATLFLAAGPLVARQPAPGQAGSGGPAVRITAPEDDTYVTGRVVLVNFWATWCEPCRAEMSSMELLREAFAGKPFEILAVNYGESREKVAAFVKSASLDLPVLLDPGMEVASQWGVKGLPMSFLVDGRGRILWGDQLLVVTDQLKAQSIVQFRQLKLREKANKARVAVAVAERNIQNLKVVATDPDQGLIMIKGAVPGAPGGWVRVTDAVKRARPKDAPFPAAVKA